MDNKDEYARLNMDFIDTLKKNAIGLASRVGSLALESESIHSQYPSGAYDLMVSMYLNLKAMILLIDLAIEEGKVEKDETSEYLLIDPNTFIKITECSQMSIATYDDLTAAYNINLTIH